MRSTWSWSAARTLRSTLAGLAAITAPALAQSQQASVSGRITDKTSGQPIQEARILVIGTSLFTSSGVDGRYTVRNVPPGTAEIRVLRVGYQEQKRSVPIVAGQTATLDITMTQSVVQLDEVVTTATGQQRRIELGNAVDEPRREQDSRRTRRSIRWATCSSRRRRAFRCSHRT